VLDRGQVQALSGREDVAVFFTGLGYNVDTRLEQTPANLNISPDSVVRKIRHIERLADQEGYFQVYLFEVDSVTVELTRSLARTFRDFKGHYLLVLTSDYEQIDFVLVETIASHDTNKSASMGGQKKRGFRPLVLSVQRRKPTRVDLRVLRRFEYTEADPIAHYEKLLSAYGVAYWSEEHFNNRALFSDYYLVERLRDQPEWKEDARPTYQTFETLFASGIGQFAGKPEAVLRKTLLLPAFEALGFKTIESKSPTDDSIGKPDYMLCFPDGREPISAALTYNWNRNLDGPDETRDIDTSRENPSQAVVSILESGKQDWVIVTNGKTWRLYSKRAHSRATNYYEIDLEEVMALADPSEAFRYFWLFFRSKAFQPGEKPEAEPCFLDGLLDGSQEYAKELGERLKDRAFRDIFPHLAGGFVEGLGGSKTLLDKPEEQREAELQDVFLATLTLLYRLLFLLYAEARDLLPVKEMRGYFQKSLTRLKKEIAERGGASEAIRADRLRKHYGGTGTELYARLSELFEMIDNGDPSINLPTYNGGLFVTDPPQADDSDETRNARFLRDHSVPDRRLALALDLLARDEDEKRLELVFIDYKSLGVRQLGSIYEGLLEFKVEIAPQKLGVTKEKGKEVYKPWRALSDRAKLRAERRGDVIRKGEVYLSNDKRERKATGSYYTPDYIVKYIVDHAVGPVLVEHLERMRPKLRKAQQHYRQCVKNNEGKAKAGLPVQGPDIVVGESEKHLAEKTFDFRVLDPAMGSGHFLVEAVDFITDRMIDFLNKFPWNPVIARLRRMRETILKEMEAAGISIDPARLTDTNLLKRHVLKRCVYGVDLNPMAVELAKVSLWLDCFTLGAPLSFLDHHLKCGNSLIGANIAEVKAQVEMDLFGSQFAGLLTATEGMIKVGQLTDVTVDQIRESTKAFQGASEILEPFKSVLDLWTARYFTEPIHRKAGINVDIRNLFLSGAFPRIEKGWQERLGKKAAGLSESAVASAQENRFFHWELEFPEVFLTKGVSAHARGFDTVVGNPPYDVLEKERGAKNWPHEDLLHLLKHYPFYEVCLGGKINLYRPFIARCFGLLKKYGYYSQIIPMSFMGDISLSKIRIHCLENYQLLQCVGFPQKDDPNRRVFREAKLSTCILLVRKEKPTVNIRTNIRVFPGCSLNEKSMESNVTLDMVRALDPQHSPLPTRTQAEIDIAAKIHANAKRLKEIAQINRGEINQTIYRRFICGDSRLRPLLKGVEVRPFGFNTILSQGFREYFNENQYAKSVKKFRSPPKVRIAMQRITGVDEGKRLVCAISDNQAYFADSTNSIVPKNPDDIQLILALLNSTLLNWRFKLTSTNNNVGTNEVEVLPYPRVVTSRIRGQIIKKANFLEMLAVDEEDVARNSEYRDLNALVYSLFELTAEEIAVVEDYKGRPYTQAAIPNSYFKNGHFSVSRQSNPYVFVKVLEAITIDGSITALRLKIALKERGEIKLSSDDTADILREMTQIGWTESDANRVFRLSEEGQRLVRDGIVEQQEALARELVVANDRVKDRIASRILGRLWEINPNNQGAVIIPKPTIPDDLGSDKDAIVTWLAEHSAEWLKGLSREMSGFPQELSPEKLASDVIKVIKENWEKLSSPERRKRLQQSLRDQFLHKVFGSLDLLSRELQIWQSRLDWAGLTMTARDLSGVAGAVWFPVGGFRKELAEGFVKVDGLIYQSREYYVYSPSGEEFEEKFLNVLFEEYLRRQKEEGVEYVSLPVVRDRVCYRLRLGAWLFQSLLENLFPKCVRGEVIYGMAIEVDITPAERRRLEHTIPIVISGVPRYVLAMRKQ